MKRDHTVYILGAGFSAKARVPLVADFLARVRRNFEDPAAPPLSGELEEHYRRVLEFRHRIARVSDYVSLELDNIEVLFSLLEMEAMLQPKGDKLLQSMRQVICHTVSTGDDPTIRTNVRITLRAEHRERVMQSPLFQQLAVTSAFPADSAHLAMNYYTYALALMLGHFRVGAAGRKCTFISLNYDTIVERAARQLGIGIDYGVARIVAKSSGIKLGGGNALHLLKLHGSANWASSNTRGTRAHVFAEYSEYGTTREPLVIPPTWRKGDMTEMFGSVWPNAALALRDATEVVVIGYSLPVTDQHVRHLFTTALADNPGIHSLEVVNYNYAGDDAIQRQYEDLFQPLARYNKLRYRTDGFEQYVSVLASSPLGAAIGGIGEAHI